MLNECKFIGRVGKDVEVRLTQSGTKVANFSLAASEKYRDNQGNQQEKTEWVNCVLFGNKNGDGLAGVAEKYVSKGDLLYVSGKMQTRKWQDQSGADRYSTEFIINDMKMLGGKSNAGGGQSSGYQEQSNSLDDDLSDSIPF